MSSATEEEDELNSDGDPQDDPDFRLSINVNTKRLEQDAQTWIAQGYDNKAAVIRKFRARYQGKHDMTEQSWRNWLGERINKSKSNRWDMILNRVKRDKAAMRKSIGKGATSAEKEKEVGHFDSDSEDTVSPRTNRNKGKKRAREEDEEPPTAPKRTQPERKLQAIPLVHPQTERQPSLTIATTPTLKIAAVQPVPVPKPTEEAILSKPAVDLLSEEPERLLRSKQPLSTSDITVPAPQTMPEPNVPDFLQSDEEDEELIGRQTQAEHADLRRGVDKFMRESSADVTRDEDQTQDIADQLIPEQSRSQPAIQPRQRADAPSGLGTDRTSRRILPESRTLEHGSSFPDRGKKRASRASGSAQNAKVVATPTEKSDLPPATVPITTRTARNVIQNKPVKQGKQRPTTPSDFGKRDTQDAASEEEDAQVESEEAEEQQLEVDELDVNLFAERDDEQDPDWKPKANIPLGHATSSVTRSSRRIAQVHLEEEEADQSSSPIRSRSDKTPELHVDEDEMAEDAPDEDLENTDDFDGAPVLVEAPIRAPPLSRSQIADMESFATKHRKLFASQKWKASVLVAHNLWWYCSGNEEHMLARLQGRSANPKAWRAMVQGMFDDTDDRIILAGSQKEKDALTQRRGKEAINARLLFFSMHGDVHIAAVGHREINRTTCFPVPTEQTAHTVAHLQRQKTMPDSEAARSGRKRAIVLYCVDVDCCAPWLATGNGSKPSSTTLSRGVFGANVGLERLLKLFDDAQIPATFNIPSHTFESFPKQTSKILQRDRHEIGLHGYLHEDVSALTEEQEREILRKSIEVYKRFTGRQPKGWIAPNWEASTHSIRLLEEAGLVYDHSLFAHDFQPHWAADFDGIAADFSKSPATWMKPLSSVKFSSKIVEIPGNWDLTDFAALNFVPAAPNSHGYVDVDLIERNWRTMFSYCYSTYETFVFPLTIHPQSSGKPHVLMMHQRFINWLKSHDHVEFLTCAEAAELFRKGEITGADLECGV